MSREELNIGCTPCDEPCVQVGHLMYSRIARAECQQFILDLESQILRKWPEGGRIALRIKGCPHDHGTYYEVFAYYDPDDPVAVAQALFCEGEADEHWSDESKSVIQEIYNKYNLSFDHPED